MEKTERMNEKFIEEFGSEDSVRKYTTGTAGYGINYLLRNDYAKLYLSVVDSYLGASPATPQRRSERLRTSTPVSVRRARLVPPRGACGQCLIEGVRRVGGAGRADGRP